ARTTDTHSPACGVGRPARHSNHAQAALRWRLQKYLENCPLACRNPYLLGGCTLASKIGESWGDGVMAAHDFHLITHWRVRSSLEEVYSILINPRDYPRWWPEVFLRAQEVRHGDAVGASRTARFNVRGYLPYSLWFQAEVVEARFPFGFTTEVNGDFNGRGIWTFQKAG